MQIRLLALITALSVASGIITLAPAHAAPKSNAKLCKVVDRGFTVLSDSTSDGPRVSVGVVARNSTRTDAVQVELKVNTYDINGKLTGTQEFGLQNIPAKQTVVDGYTWTTRGETASIKVLLTCQKPSGYGLKKLPRYQTATGTYEQGGEPPITGTFVNRQKTADFYNVFFILRNTENKIVGGDFTNSLGAVPKGQDIAWDSGLRLPETLGPLRVTANTSSVYSAF